MFVNPVMHNYTFAILNYCDGSSGTSALEEPMEGVCESIENTPDKLYFRGKYIKEAAFEQLVKRGIMNAENVVIAGNSAGALAAQLHANFYKERLPNARVTGLSDSGIFLDYDTGEQDVTCIWVEARTGMLIRTLTHSRTGICGGGAPPAGQLPSDHFSQGPRTSLPRSRH